MAEKLFNHPEFPKKKLYKTDIKKIADRRLSFCFEHSSIKQGYVCFNNPNHEPQDIIKLIECFKKISNYSLSEIYDNKKELRFHEVDIKHRAYLGQIYKRTLNFNVNIDTYQLPTLWQLEVFTDNQRNIAPRITFYILSDAVAKVVYFDYHHLLCSQVYSANNNVPDNWYEHYID